MKDDFDKRLKDRITGVFDNYEDVSADAGWALLREKYPEKKKRRGILWLWMGSAAAVILLFLSIWIWEGNNSHRKLNKIVGKIGPQQKRFSDTSGQASKTNIASVQTHPATSPLSNASVQNSSQNANILFQKNPGAVKQGRQLLIGASNQQVITSQQNPALTNQPAKPNTQQNHEQQAIAANQNISQKTEAEALTDTSVKNITQNIIVPTKPAMKSPFTENDPAIKNDKSKKTNADNSKLASFGIYAATYVSYASGSSNQVNVGVGFASDIHLAKNLKLSTGVAIGQNTLDYGNHLPQRQGLYAAAAAVPLQNVAYSNNSAASYSLPVLKNYNAQLTSLDVPLNLKYEFNPQKNSSFVSLGVSSGTFINETYSSQYSSASSATQTVNSNIESFSSFYLAKTLDFSFGLGYPIGKNRLSVEPFVKYPLQGLGANQIRFGSGGLNLKFNFSSNKK